MCFMFCRPIAKEFGNEFCLNYITNAYYPKLSKAKFVMPKAIKCVVLAAQFFTKIEFYVLLDICSFCILSFGCSIFLYLRV
jgi:hypothetical protein